MEAERLLLHFALVVANLRQLQAKVYPGCDTSIRDQLHLVGQEVDDLVALHLMPGRPDPYTAVAGVPL